MWYKKCGFHSVLIYDYEPRCNAFRVSGLRWLTTCDGWIFGEDLNQIMVCDPKSKKWQIRKYKTKIGCDVTVSPELQMSPEETFASSLYVPSGCVLEWERHNQEQKDNE